MNTRKVVDAETKGKNSSVKGFDHYVALDWSSKIVAIAHIRRSADSQRAFERGSGIEEFKL